MSPLRLYASDDAATLVSAFVERRAPQDNPLVRETVVVPNLVVSQWFEQAVARRTGRPGHDDGVVANVDSVFPAGLLGRLLYRDASALERWSTPALAMDLLGVDGSGPTLSMGDALARGAALERLITLRSESLDEVLAGAEFGRERRVLELRAARGSVPPRTALERDGLVGRDGVGSWLTVFGCLETPTGALLADVVTALAETADVDVFLSLPSRRLLDVDARGSSLLRRWTTGLSAHLDEWRARTGSGDVAWLEGPPPGEHRRRVRDALSSEGAGSGVPTPTPFVELHHCVGFARQVEIARDALQTVMEDLHVAPHEVRVVTSDASVFAPLIATLWQPSAVEDGSPRLQFEIADPAVTRRSARLDAFRAWLASLDGDFTIHDVAELLGQSAVRNGFGLTTGDGERIVALAREGRVSFGLDAAGRATRAAFDPDDDSGTWERFTDRVVLATVFEQDRDDEAVSIKSLGVPDDLAIVARFEQLVTVLRDAVTLSRSARTLSQWNDLFVRWSELLARDERSRDSSLDQLLGRLGDLGGQSDATLSLAEVRDLVDNVVSTSGGGSLFGRGGVSVLDPIASATLPYRITVFLGLDEDLLPQPGRRVDELGDARPTDPERRDQLRTALVHLISSTSERVLLFANDRHVVDGSDVPLSLPLLELVDALAGAALAPTVRRHPRYGFSTWLATASPAVRPVRADVETVGSPEPAFSRDPVHATLATQLAGRDEPRPEDDLPLWRVDRPPVDSPAAVDVEEVIRYLEHPQAVFLRDAFGAARITASGPERSPEVPYLDFGDHLVRWGVRERMLHEAVATGALRVPRDPDSAYASIATGMRERALADLAIEELERYAEAIRESLEEAAARPAPRARRPGVVTGLSREVSRPPVDLFETRSGPVIFNATTSTSYDSRLLALLVRQALTTVETGDAVSGVLMRGLSASEAKGPPIRPFLISRWTPGDAVENARATLDRLLALYDRRLEGVPFHFAATSLATSDRFAALGTDPRAKWLRTSYGRGREERGESTQPVNRLLFPLEYEELTQVHNGAFLAASRELTEALGAFVLSEYADGSSWPSRLSGEPV